MPIVTEVMDISHLPLFENVDVIQVGARNIGEPESCSKNWAVSTSLSSSSAAFPAPFRNC